MSRACRWLPLLVAAALGWVVPLAGAPAATSEKGAFDAASNALRDGFYDRAEVWFGEYLATYTNSTRLSEAMLCQAQARLEMTNYAGALALLTNAPNSAGKLADKYLYWQAEVYRRKADYATAAELFGKLVMQHTNSTRRLEAAIGEATARSKLGDWKRVAELLQQADGVFQVALRSNPANEWVWYGCLLLAEAQILRQDFGAAEQILLPLAKYPMPPRLAWQRQYFLCQLQLAQQRLDDALQGATNLLALAAVTGQRQSMAESTTFQAALLERLGRSEEAVRAYTNNLAEGLPADHQRQALLKITELSLARNKIAEAAQTLDSFCVRYPDAASADLALLTLAELRLRQYLTGETNRFEAVSTNAPMVTNRLQQAVAALNTVLTKTSPLVGKAQLDLGWCYWLDNDWAKCQAACQAALALLPPSADRATAHFKLGDAQFQQKDYEGGLTNYNAVVALCGQIPELKTNLCEPALYQAVRAGLAAGKVTVAEAALKQLLETYPAGFYTDRALLQTGQEEGRKNPLRARQYFAEFVQKVPGAPLMPELRLAIARTFEQEGKWSEALQEYGAWIERYTNSTALPRAKYHQALASYHSGSTNALALFSKLPEQYPTNEFAPLAQWWVADYYYQNGDPGKAEQYYKPFFQTTNWPNSPLTYPARMMAGRAALACQRWTDAIEHFTNLTRDASCPTNILIQAMFAYGDALISLDPTNYPNAARLCNLIVTQYPNRPEAVLALGQRANCLLQQWAQEARPVDSPTNALLAFREVIAHPRADFSARSIARVGLATVLQKQADLVASTNQTAILREALDQCLAVYYWQKELRDGEQPDWFWIKKAGLEAAALAERLQDWQAAINVYRGLKTQLPPLEPMLEKKIAKAQESLARKP